MSSKSKSPRLKAFFIECSAPSWALVAKHLSEGGIDPVYWTAWLHSKQEIENNFSDIIFHDTIDAKRNIPHARFAQAKTALFTEQCRAIWESEAQTVYEMMIRFDHGRDLIYIDMALYFYSALIYWNRVLEDLQPDVVIFPTTPHVVYDYILFCLCNAKKINTLIFEQAWIYPPYSLLMDDFREGSPKLRSRVRELMAEKKHVELSDAAKTIVNRISDSYDVGKPISEKIIHASAHAELSDEELIDRETDLIKRNRRLEDDYYRLRDKPNAQHQYTKQVNVASLAKQRGRSLAQSFEGLYPNTQYLEQRLEQVIATRRLHAFYKGLCSKPDFKGEKYIFLPMMFQPERSSCPQGGIFSNQFLITNLLANTVPEGCFIYVKEHPTQFHPNMQANQARSEEFYETIARFKNVKIIDTDIDPFRLIDGCWAVATGGGTAAIEAAIRGKPSIVFGHAYFNDCAGIHWVSSENELKTALKEIEGNGKVDVEDVKRFFYAIETSLFEANADLNMVTVTPEANAKVMAGQILSELKKMGYDVRAL